LVTAPPCNICLEETCEGKRNCDCLACDKQAECYRFLKPTLRITRKCTQHCSHCCFSCSPKATEMMSVETAEQVAKFYENNNIFYTQLMGGECFMNPEWETIFRMILPKVKRARVVTNGDWVVNHMRFADVLAEFPQVVVAISNDEWHTNTHIKVAEQACNDRGIDCVVSDEDLKEDGIVPVGNGDLYYSLYSSFSCWCHKPDRMYNFLIGEDGTIYKCDMGVWDYDNVKYFVDGGFASRFKEFNQVFYKQFLSNCKRCYRAYKWKK